MSIRQDVSATAGLVVPSSKHIELELSSAGDEYGKVALAMAAIAVTAAAAVAAAAAKGDVAVTAVRGR